MLPLRRIAQERLEQGMKEDLREMYAGEGRVGAGEPQVTDAECTLIPTIPVNEAAQTPEESSHVESRAQAAECVAIAD
jgi:hypothetical protein